VAGSGKERATGGVQRLTSPADNLLILFAGAFGIGLAISTGMQFAAKALKALGWRQWNWRTCWREAEFWLALATLLLPFGVLLLLRHWEPIRLRVRRLL
jgi:hypothetical protein